MEENMRMLRTGFEQVVIGWGRLVVFGIAALLSLPALGVSPDSAPQAKQVSGPACREKGAPNTSRVLILRIPPEPETPRSAVAPTAPEVVGGMVVFRDPVTGRFRKPATPEEAQEIRRQIQAAVRFRPPPREVPVKGPAGGFGVRLDGRFLNALTVHKDAVGRLVFDCTDSDPSATDRSPSAEGR
jgi:hypothetical protein